MIALQKVMIAHQDIIVQKELAMMESPALLGHIAQVEMLSQLRPPMGKNKLQPNNRHMSNALLEKSAEQQITQSIQSNVQLGHILLPVHLNA